MDAVPRAARLATMHLDNHQVTDEAQYIDYDDLARVAPCVQ